MGVVEEAREFAVYEAKEYGTPILPHFEISEKIAVELAQKFNADLDIVKIGVYLMDVKLGQALKEKRLKEHVEMSIYASKEFLNKFDISDTKKEKIINCVAAHHAQVPFTCKEAEICANAECYRFLHPTGIFAYMHLLAKERCPDFLEMVKQAECKLDEKWGILSLDICKKELESYYKSFKQFFADARKFGTS
ncbi:hypothetical protein JW868_03035 [Candidatus Woesearchaeota archaeon]|nr:hypothetical protein [Candidatus Woesearchaeota archaeon]